MIIAIDGYSSCGKSTVAKSLAKRLGFKYIDSGAMYRAVTKYFLENNIPLDDSLEPTKRVNYQLIMEDIHIEFKINAETNFSEIYLNGKNVEVEIRKMNISDHVSQVSRILEVRKTLVSIQRSYGKNHDLVMDGRDIGTTVFPDADIKIFMTADLRIRAERRYLELKMNGVDITIDKVMENLRHRDEEDSMRELSPLMKAADAIILDNSYMNFEQQLAFVMNIIASAKKKHES